MVVALYAHTKRKGEVVAWGSRQNLNEPKTQRHLRYRAWLLALHKTETGVIRTVVNTTKSIINTVQYIIRRNVDNERCTLAMLSFFYLLTILDIIGLYGHTHNSHIYLVARNQQQTTMSEAFPEHRTLTL